MFLLVLGSMTGEMFTAANVCARVTERLDDPWIHPCKHLNVKLVNGRVMIFIMTWWCFLFTDESEAWKQLFTHTKPAKSVRCPLERPPAELVWPWTCPDRQCKWQNLSRFNVKSYRGRPELNEDGSHPGLDSSLSFLLWLVIISGASTSLRGAKT